MEIEFHNKETCESCRFWLRIEATNGICRVKPPQGMMVPMAANKFKPQEVTPTPISFFPPVQADNWCGAFEQSFNS